MSIEQEGNRTVIEAARPLLLTDRQTDGDAAHVADLQIEQDDVGVSGLDNRQNIGTGADSEDVAVIGGQRGVDIGGQVVGVGGKQHGRHPTNATTREPKCLMPPNHDGPGPAHLEGK